MIALVVLVLGQLAAWVHDGAVRHVRCASHGELVDAPELAVTSGLGEGVWLVGVERSSNDDEHCAAANGLRQDLARRAPAIATQLAPPVAIVVSAPAAHRPAVAATYRLAPKTSPPDLAV